MHSADGSKAEDTRFTEDEEGKRLARVCASTFEGALTFCRILSALFAICLAYYVRTINVCHSYIAI